MNNFKKARKDKNFTQSYVAEILNVTNATISRYETGNMQPDNETLKQLSELYSVSIDYLLGNDEKQIKNAPKGVKIPVLGRVVAGIPIEAVTDILDYEEIPAEMARTGDYFALKIKGNSMSPRICDGDVVIVRKQELVENKEVAIVLVDGLDATIKEVQFSENGLTLVGWNVADYQPHFYTKDDIKNLPVQIIGKVVELRGKF